MKKKKDDRMHADDPYSEFPLGRPRILEKDIAVGNLRIGPRKMEGVIDNLKSSEGTPANSRRT